MMWQWGVVWSERKVGCVECVLESDVLRILQAVALFVRTAVEGLDLVRDVFTFLKGVIQ